MSSTTAIALLFALILASVMGFILTLTSLPAAFGLGLLLVVLVTALASNEVALYLLVLSMLLGPQVVTGQLGEGTQLGRGLTLRLDDVLLTVVGVAWLAKTALYKEIGLVFRTPLNHAIVAYSLAAIVATGLGIAGGRVRPLGGVLFTLKYIQYFVIYFMVVNNLRERRQFERLLGVLLATCAVASVIGTLQIPSGQRVSAPFEGAQGEPNTFGGYLILMLAVVAGLYLTSRSVRLKVPLVVLAGLIVLPLAFTLSRATYLAVIPLGIALFVWGRRRLFLAAGLALALALGPFVVPDVVVERLRYTFAQPPEEGQRQLVGIRLDTSTSARFGSWEQVLFEDWSKHPVFGYGVTGYRFVDAQYPRTLAEMGLVGLLALLWLQVSLFREARRVLERARDPLFRGVALGFLGGFVALLAHSIGANTFIIVRTMEPFWFLAGMVMMIPQLEAAGAPTTVPDVARPRRSAWRPRAAGEAYPRPT